MTIKSILEDLKPEVTQKDIAEKAGFSEARFSNYKKGKRTPGIRECRTIIQALRHFGVECTIDDLFPPKESDND